MGGGDEDSSREDGARQEEGGGGRVTPLPGPFAAAPHELTKTSYPRKWQYALGLAREVHVPERKHKIVRSFSSLDHAIVLFTRDASATKRKDGGWKICQVLAAVEIKLENSTCHEFEGMNDKTRIKIKPDDLAVRKGGAGPLGQEVLYTLGHVVWSRAVLGLELPKNLPLAVVAAKKKKKKKKKKKAEEEEEGGLNKSEGRKRMHWVYGNLIIPDEFGGQFSFNVSSCGAFQQDTSPTSAAAAYITVLMEGLEAGERWMENMKKKPPDNDSRPWPRSLCGRRLFFGGSPLEMYGMTLAASPASMRKMEFAISQGELYRGRVNLVELQDTLGRRRDVFWCLGARTTNLLNKNTGAMAEALSIEAMHNSESLRLEREAVGMDSVLVKVTSQACHKTMLGQNALLWKLLLERPSSELVKGVSPLLSGSLHAIYGVGDSGLVQLMPDLHTAGYHPLRPKWLEEEGRFRRMCQSFLQFVERILVPLALLGVIHVDIRAAYIETANILCHKDNLTMRLIDLDSLLAFVDIRGLVKDSRIVSKKNGPSSAGIGSAIEFVCLQCVCVATSWLIGKKVADSAGDESARRGFEEELDTENIISKYLLKNVKGGQPFDSEERTQFFSGPDSEACSFVLKQVRLILEEFLEEGID